jgi:dihydrofolate reductase
MRVIALAVVSLDGYIAHGDRSGTAFASAEDQRVFRMALREFQAVVMGRSTYEVERERIRQRPAGRLRCVMTRSPERYASEELPGLLEFTDAAPRDLAYDLADRGVERLAVLGGSHIYRAFAAERVIHEWWITVEPLLFGSGTPLLSGPVDQRLRLIEQRRLNESTLHLRYEVA